MRAVGAIRFRLRSLLALVTLSALVCAVLTGEWHRAQERRRFFTERAYGCQLSFDDRSAWQRLMGDVKPTVLMLRPDADENELRLAQRLFPEFAEHLARTHAAIR